MSNELTVLKTGAMPSVFASRANLPNMAAAAQANLAASYAIIGYKGRNWRLKHRGEEELLMHGGVPIPTLSVVVVGVAAAISKQFYDKKYSEGDDASPDCFSNNGITPDLASSKKQCTTCAACPQNVWGSRITENGKRAKACQDSRRVAVVPRGDIENEGYGGPMLLRLPPMSLNGFAKYGRDIQRFGAEPFMVGTTIGFDYDVAYPLITFSAEGWLSDEEATLVAKVLDDPLIPQMLNEAVPAGDDAAPAKETAQALAGGTPAASFDAQAHAAAEKRRADEAATLRAAEAQAQRDADKALVAQAEAEKKAAAAKVTPPKTTGAAAFGAKAPTAPAAPAKTGGFGAKAATPAAVQTAAPAAEEATATTVVQGAPTDMEAAIDELLG